MPEYQSFRDSGAACNLLGRGSLETLPGEEARGHREDLLAAVSGAKAGRTGCHSK
jgi:hypothetical protein